MLSKETLQLEFEAIGTHWNIELFNLSATVQTSVLKEKVLNRINEFDAIYSRFRDDSLVTKMSKAAGTYELPKDALPLLDLYQELYTLTNGLVTPLIGNALEQAGYDAAYSLEPKVLKI